MTIDLNRALYSHCEHDPEQLSATWNTVLEVLVAQAVGAVVRPTRVVTYLQGAVTLLDHDLEFRLHVWFELPQGHPAFTGADRGLACIVRPVDRDGLTGPLLTGVGWLGQPLPEDLTFEADDWVGQMVRDQGYLSIPGAEWMEATDEPMAPAMLGWMLGKHLDGMTNHVILEERLLRQA